MKKYLAFAAMLLITGCMSNNQTYKKQSTPQPTRIVTHGQSTVHTTSSTHASSTRTTKKNKSTIKTRQAPTLPDGLLEIRVPSQGPIGAPNQQPVQQPTQQPVQQPTKQPTQQPSPPAQHTGQPAKDTQGFNQQVLDLVNKQRQNAGLKTLSMDDSLSHMALVKAQDMINNNYFDHNSPTYGSPFDMMQKFQITYSYAGENIAKGQTTAEQVMNDWMNSEGHRANILNNNYTKIGIGYYNGAWVQEFTG
jgi:uncharacterized YkwD family protein